MNILNFVKYSLISVFLMVIISVPNSFKISTYISFVIYFITYSLLTFLLRKHTYRSIIILFAPSLFLIYSFFNFPYTRVLLLSIIIIFIAFVCFKHVNNISKKYVLRFILLVASVSYFGYGLWPNIHSYIDYVFLEKEYYGKKVNFEAIDKSSETINLVFDNKINIIDFWSSGCGYCFKSFPKFDSTMNKYNNEKITYYAIGLVSRKESVTQLDSIFKKFQNSFESYYVGSKDTYITQELGILGVPQIIVTDIDGNIVYKGRLILNEKVYNNLDSIIVRELKRVTTE